MVGTNKRTAAHVLLLLLLHWSCFWVVPTKHASAETIRTSLDCSATLLGVSDCLTFVLIGSREVKPHGQCCSGLQKVRPQETSCLCQESIAYGMKINMTKARTLAPACGLKTPPYSTCNMGSNAPGAAPVFSPAAVPVPAPVPSASPTSGQNIASVPPPPPQVPSSVAATLPVPSLVLLVIATAAFVSNHL